MRLAPHPRSGARQPAPGDAARWFESLDALFRVPAGFRDECVSRVEAAAMLGCGDELLGELVARGLPCSGEPGAERFDRYDLFNLGLYSGTGSSLPERGIRFALRWMSGAPETWFRPARWTFSVELACPREGGCGADPWWSLALPRPDAFGGRTLHLESTPGGATAGPGDAECGGGGLALSATLETRGQHLELRSPALLRITHDFMERGHRWVRLPEELQRRPELVLPAGVAPCISASLWLQQRFGEAGFEARTRRGWILGMLDLAHAWVEVRDVDGVVKPVDPVFAMLAAHAEAAHPDFAAACLGSRMNRLLPTAHAADEPLSRHRCGGRESRPAHRTVIRAARSTAPGGATVNAGNGGSRS